jgi:hypothetical protein
MPMRTRTPFVLCIPLIAVIATGCSDKPPGPPTPPITGKAVVGASKRGGAKTPKKPKIINQTGPTDMVD